MSARRTPARRPSLVAGIPGAVSAALSLAFAVQQAAALNAFPGAEGFGADTTGGHGSTDVYHVTSLSDANTPGTFRYGVTHAPAGGAPRTVVFDVGGDIVMASKISITVPNLTIAGQTAPGQGITFTGWDTYISASNVQMRYLHFRPGDTNGPLNGGTFQGDSMSIFGSSTNTVTNVIVDHISTSFSIDENLSATWCNKVTVQNSIIAEALNNAGHSNGSGGTETHAYGSLIGNGNGSVTYARNMYESNRSRNPRVGSDYTLEFVNNVTYNWNGMDGYSGAATEGITKLNYIGNYGVAGPTTASHTNDVFVGGSTNTLIYQSGNMIDGNKNGVLDGSNTNWSMFTGSYTQQASPATGVGTKYPVTIDTALGAYNGIVQGAGDSLSRDATDTRQINNLLNQTGTIIDSQTQVGYTPLASAARPAGFDSDNDGIPNTWESAHGLNSAAFDSQKLNPLGYTMLEQYLNELALSSTPVRTWTATSGEWNTAANWGARPTMYDLASVQANGADALATVTTTTPTCFQLQIGGGSGGSAKVQVSTGGTLAVVDTIFVGNTGPGTLQIDAGTVQSQYLILGNTVSGSTYTGTLTLNGGTLKTRQIALGGGAPGAWTTGGSIQWNGGTIQALDTFTNNAPIAFGSGTGAILDTNGFNATFSGALSGPGGLTQIGTGTLTLTGVAAYSGTTSVADTLLVMGNNSSLGPITGAGSLQLTGGGGRNLTSDGVTVSNWQVDLNSTHTIRPGSLSGTSKVNTLTLAGGPGAWTSRVELNANALIVQSDSSSKATELATLVDQITNTTGGTKGITSNSVAADPSHKALFAVDNALLGLTLFGGLPVDANSILVEATYKGDANLDRKVDVIDLGVLATNYGTSTTGGITKGDYNQDGKVDVIDLGILATDYGLGTTGGGFSLQADTAQFAIATPEPASLALLTLGLAGLFRRSRHFPRVRSGAGRFPPEESPRV